MSERGPASVHFSRRSAQRACAYCREPLDPEPWLCSLCQTALHGDCAAELVACPSLGCPGLTAFREPAAVEDPQAPWRLRDPGLEGVSVTDSAEESRLTFDPFVDEERAKPAAKGLLWLVGLAVPIAALVWVVLGASWLWSLAPGLLISLALVSSSFEPDKEKRRWRRLRSLSIVARSGSWELIEGFINIEAPTIRRLTPPLSFDASAGEAGLIHIGDEELRLPPRAADEQRRLVELLQAAWEQRSFDEA